MHPSFSLPNVIQVYMLRSSYFEDEVKVYFELIDLVDVDKNKMLNNIKNGSKIFLLFKSLLY